jgi:hypothetical protein
VNHEADSKKPDLVAKAKQQMTAAAAEFQHGLARVKDPAQRRKLTADYVDMVGKYLTKLQVALVNYRGKLLDEQHPDMTDEPTVASKTPTPPADGTDMPPSPN